MARGLRFCLPPKEVDKYDVKCSLELLFRDLSRHGPTLSNEDQDRLKSQLKYVSYSYIYSYDFSKQKRILNKEEWSALNNDDINWDHFEMLATALLDVHCKIKETLSIKDLKSALNENVGSEKLFLY